MSAEAAPSPALAWNWGAAAVGVAYALPAAIVALGDVRAGVALAVGVLPAAIVGVLPRRRARPAVIVIGVMTGVPMFVGGLLAGTPVLAVAGVFAFAVAAAAPARHRRLGMLALFLSVPLLGVGLSYDDLGAAAGLGGLMIAGSVYACAVSMLWPEQPPGAPRPAGNPVTIGYGVRLGAAGACAAAFGFALDLDHVGWACAAALLVMRPAAEMQELRSVGRVASIVVGSVLAILFIRIDPSSGAYAAVIAAVVCGAAATSGSRWYVTPAFTTYLVFLLLLYADPGDAPERFAERLGETAAGVAIAYFFGLALPALGARANDWSRRSAA